MAFPLRLLISVSNDSEPVVEPKYWNWLKTSRSFSFSLMVGGIGIGWPIT